MTHFYSHLGRHEGKAEALRQAQLAMLNSAPHRTTGLASSLTVIRIAPCSVPSTQYRYQEQSMTTNAMASPTVPIQPRCERQARHSGKRPGRPKEEVLFSRKAEWRLASRS